MDLNHIAGLVKSLAWPVTILVVLAYFRHELTGALKRIEGAKLPGGTELSFGRAQVDKLAARQPIPTTLRESAVIDKSKIANIYWLGFDLMWTGDVILRDGPAQIVLRGLSHAVHHMTEIGAIDTPDGRQLIHLLDEAKSMQEKDWHSHARDRFAVELSAIANAMGSRLATLQPGFVARPTPEP